MAVPPRISPSVSAVSRHLAPVVLGACALCLPACAPELNWRTVEAPQAHGLTGLFPCKPDRFERKVPWSGLPGAVDMHLLSCQAQGRVWSVSYVTLPDVGLVMQALRQWPEITRQNLRLSAASPDAVRARDMGPVQVPRMTPSADAHAWHFEAARRDGSGATVPVRIEAWHFFHGMTVFQASVSGAPAQADGQSSEDVAQAFFRGFQFPG